MKWMKYAAIAALSVVVIACSSSPKDKLIGKWQVTAVDASEMLKTIPEEQKAFVEKMIPQFEEMMKTIVMTFEKDGKMNTKANMMGKTSDENGTYTLSEDGKELSIKTKGDAQKMKIESMTDKEMKIEADMDGAKIKMTLVKK